MSLDPHFRLYATGRELHVVLSPRLSSSEPNVVFHYLPDGGVRAVLVARAWDVADWTAFLAGGEAPHQ